MARRLVSFLGTGKNGVAAPECYDPAQYQFEGRDLVETRVIGRALLEEFGPIDEVVFLGTKDVVEKWVDTRALNDELGRDDIRFLRTPHGGKPDDPWTIFSLTLAALGLREAETHDGTVLPESLPSTIIFDVTHGFRAQPMVGLAALNFASSEWRRQQRDAPEVRVFYGAFEARTTETKPPLWELTDVVSANEWNAAIDSLVRFGRADHIEQLAKQLGTEQTRAAQARGVTGRNLGRFAFPKQLGEKARAFADDLALGRLSRIVKDSAPALAGLLTSENAFAFAHAIPAVESTLQWLAATANSLAGLSLSGPSAPESFARFADEYHRLQQFALHAASIREGAISAFAVQTGAAEPEPGTPEYPSIRTAVERELTAFTSQLKDAKRRTALEQRSSTALWKLLELANGVHPSRNDIEHLGLNDKPAAASDLVARLRKATAEFRQVASPDEVTTRFLNLSNHKLETWPDEQRDSVGKLGFGEPADLEGGMPEVPPAATADGVVALARSIADRAVAQDAAGAYVAGEHTLTLALVHELQRRGVRCFSATTRRDTEQRSLDDRTVERKRRYRFEGWREYTRSVE